MIVRLLDSIRNSSRHIQSKTNRNWSSLRYLLKIDGLPFSVNHTELEAGCRMELAYQNHQEACLCIAGRGKLFEMGKPIPHNIEPGVLYALELGERHILEAIEDLTLISIFSPALLGPEIHNAQGSYEELTLDA